MKITGSEGGSGKAVMVIALNKNGRVACGNRAKGLPAGPGAALLFQRTAIKKIIFPVEVISSPRVNLTLEPPSVQRNSRASSCKIITAHSFRVPAPRALHYVPR